MENLIEKLKKELANEVKTNQQLNSVHERLRTENENLKKQLEEKLINQQKSVPLLRHNSGGMKRK